MRAFQAIYVLDDTPPSRAGSLLQGFKVYAKLIYKIQNQYYWEIREAIYGLPKPPDPMHSKNIFYAVQAYLSESPECVDIDPNDLKM